MFKNVVIYNMYIYALYSAELKHNSLIIIFKKLCNVEKVVEKLLADF